MFGHCDFSFTISEDRETSTTSVLPVVTMSPGAGSDDGSATSSRVIVGSTAAAVVAVAVMLILLRRRPKGNKELEQALDTQVCVGWESETLFDH